MKNYQNKICMIVGFIAQIICILISIIMICKGLPKGDLVFFMMFFFGWSLPVIGCCIDK